MQKDRLTTPGYEENTNPVNDQQKRGENTKRHHITQQPSLRSQGHPICSTIEERGNPRQCRVKK